MKEVKNYQMIEDERESNKTTKKRWNNQLEITRRK